MIPGHAPGPCDAEHNSSRTCHTACSAQRKGAALLGALLMEAVTRRTDQAIPSIRGATFGRGEKP